MNPNVTASPDVIVLGTASLETQGPNVGAEDFGTPIEQGISRD